jgi:hypothetical protein
MAVIFPKWTNRIGISVAIGVPVVLITLVCSVWYWFSPEFTDVGYAPDQPVPYSHRLHAGDLGIDCRYCHYTVERSSFAAIPPVAVCMNCHEQIMEDSPRLAPIRESWVTGEAVEWTRVHLLPDFAFFNHSAHVGVGVGCVDCHGRVDQMPVVTQREPLSMSWCLDCHRDPGPHIRPSDVAVTEMDWLAPEGHLLTEVHSRAFGGSENSREVNPPLNCAGCHR